MLCHAAASYNRLGVFNNPKDSREALLDGLDSWAAEMDSAHEEAASAAAAADPAEADHQLPPVRGQGGIATKPTPTQEAKPAAAGVRKTPQKSGKSIPGGDFRAWDKYDVSKALDEMDADDLHPPKVEEVTDDEAEGGGSGGGSDRTVVNTRKMPSAKISSKPKTDAQCQQMATNEKEKGNEAFRAGDFEEAVVYYSRSIDAWPTAAVYNNRAFKSLNAKRDGIFATMMAGDSYVAKDLNDLINWVSDDDFSKSAVKVNKIDDSSPQMKLIRVTEGTYSFAQPWQLTLSDGTLLKAFIFIVYQTDPEDGSLYASNFFTEAVSDYRRPIASSDGKRKGAGGRAFGYFILVCVILIGVGYVVRTQTGLLDTLLGSSGAHSNFDNDTSGTAMGEFANPLANPAGGESRSQPSYDEPSVNEDSSA